MAEYHRTLEINGRYLTVEVVGVLQSQLVAGLGFTTWLIYFLFINRYYGYNLRAFNQT